MKFVEFKCTENLKLERESTSEVPTKEYSILLKCGRKIQDNHQFVKSKDLWRKAFVVCSIIKSFSIKINLKGRKEKFFMSL